MSCRGARVEEPGCDGGRPARPRSGAQAPGVLPDGARLGHVTNGGGSRCAPPGGRRHPEVRRSPRAADAPPGGPPAGGRRPGACGPPAGRRGGHRGVVLSRRHRLFASFAAAGIPGRAVGRGFRPAVAGPQGPAARTRRPSGRSAVRIPRLCVTSSRVCLLGRPRRGRSRRRPPRIRRTSVGVSPRRTRSRIAPRGGRAIRSAAPGGQAGMAGRDTGSPSEARRDLVIIGGGPGFVRVSCDAPSSDAAIAPGRQVSHDPTQDRLIKAVAPARDAPRPVSRPRSPGTGPIRRRRHPRAELCTR